MRAVLVGCVSFLVGLLVLGVFTRLSPAQTTMDPKRFVVVFEDEVIPPDAARLIETAGGRLIETLPEVGIGMAVSDDPYFMSSLANSALVRVVGEEPIRVLSSEAGLVAESNLCAPLPECAPVPGVDNLYFSNQWHIRRVRADLAWAITTGIPKTGPKIVVAVIDNGVARNHPDLSPNVVFTGCFWSRSPEPGCSTYPNAPTVAASHGTFVAGIIAAAFGHGRTVGVGPNLGLASYNVFEPDSSLAHDGSIWAAMLDATVNPLVKARVINLSLGELIDCPRHDEGSKVGFDAAMWTAWNRVVQMVTRKGVTIVASAGNTGRNLNGCAAHIPSDLPLVIGVGATGIRPNPEFPQLGAFDVRASYSDFGAPVSLVAPGGDCGPRATGCQNGYMVVSTAARTNSTCGMTESCQPIWITGSGTSFAAPHVAGVAGLILSQNPSLNPRQVAVILKRTAQPLGDRQQFGHGMVDAAAAVDAATAAVAP